MSGPHIKRQKHRFTIWLTGDRATTGSALCSVGFGRIEAMPKLDVFAEAMAHDSPDLVICGVEGAEGELRR
ncbi:MAG TPA: hypothetical protein VGG69_08600 [Rhizomicrobium sp.]|jgi:hypothetical protein